MSKRNESAVIDYPDGTVRDETTDYGPCVGCNQPNRILRKIMTGEESFIWRCKDCAPEEHES